MTSVRCPICDRSMTSTDKEGLNAMLRGHLSDEHDIEVPKASDSFSGTSTMNGSGEGIEEDASPVREGGRIHRAELRREEQFYAPEEGTAVPPRPKGLGDWLRKALGTDAEDGGKDEWARGQGYPLLMGREKSTYVDQRPRERNEGSVLAAQEMPLEERGSGRIKCPICGEAIAGIDEDGLSEELKLHMMGTHQIVRREALPRQ